MKAAALLLLVACVPAAPVHAPVELPIAPAARATCPELSPAADPPRPDHWHYQRAACTRMALLGCGGDAPACPSSFPEYWTWLEYACVSNALSHEQLAACGVMCSEE